MNDDYQDRYYAVTVTLTLTVHAPDTDAALDWADDAIDSLVFTGAIADYQYAVHDENSIDPPKQVAA